MKAFIKTRSRRLLIAAIVIAILALVTPLLWRNISRTRMPTLPENVVADPRGGGWILKNELAILASGGQNVKYVESIVAEFGGEITVSIEETGTYQVKFPVSNLGELNATKNKLNERGITAYYVIVLRPPAPGEPQ
jgi:hypothetical protein